MSYLIQKTIAKGGFKYWADVKHARGHSLELTWQGLRNNARKFNDKETAETFRDMIDSEMKSTDNSQLSIIEI